MRVLYKNAVFFQGGRLASRQQLAQWREGLNPWGGCRAAAVAPIFASCVREERTALHTGIRYISPLIPGRAEALPTTGIAVERRQFLRLQWDRPTRSRLA